MTYNAKVIAGGKVVIPADFRRKLDIKDGDSLVFEEDEDGALTLKTYAQVVREVQRDFAAMTRDYNGSMVDDLLAERRREAARERADHDDWLARQRP